MILLLTNDDGIESPGLTALKEEFDGIKEDPAARHRVYVSAPVRDRSGISHAISLHDPIKIRRIEDTVYSCSGYPADCVLTACLGALPEVPDCVISGVNLGPNLGTDLLYSGTAAAARQASIMGKPGIALSLASFHPPFYFKPALHFLRRFLGSIVSNWIPGFFLNINIPNVDEEDLPVEITTLAELKYRTGLSSFKRSDNEVYHFFMGSLEPADLAPGTDIAAVRDGRISVTAVENFPRRKPGGGDYSGIFMKEGK